VKKCLLALAITLLFLSAASSQEIAKTKMDTFLSTTGQIIRFIDYSLPSLKTDYEMVTVKVRLFEGKGEIQYFYQLSKETKYGSKVASILYSDLIEVIKAVDALIESANVDAKADYEYMENKFATEDGFQIGYYKKGKELKWYVKLEKIGSDTTVFFSDPKMLKTSLLAGKVNVNSPTPPVVRAA
jgi:hypothetical protein